MRSARPVVLVALCLVGAGCVGTGQPATDDPTGTDTTTDTTTTTTGPPESEVVGLEELDPSAQRLFEAALSGDGSVTSTNTTDQAFRPFVDNEYVRYEGDLYEVRGQRRMEPETFVGGVTAAEASELADDREVVNYTSLSDSAQTDFLALLDGESRTYAYEESPFPGEPTRGLTGYVVYKGTHYKLELARGERLLYHLVVSETNVSE